MTVVGEYIRTDKSFKELANNISEIEDQQLKTVKAHEKYKRKEWTIIH